MTDRPAPSRATLWFARWWLAIVAALVAAGGLVLTLAGALQPRAANSGWFAYEPLASAAPFVPAPSPLLPLGLTLLVAGLVTLAGVIGFRLGRRR